MTTTTLTLAAFLLQRVAEDEAMAQAATDGPWAVSSAGCAVIAPRLLRFGHGASEVALSPDDGRDDPDIAHIARHDPARVLAQCAAVRAVVGLGGNECAAYADGPLDLAIKGLVPSRHYPDPDYAGHCEGCEGAMAADETWTAALRHLAAVYASHPDYDESWRP